jgi:carboxymethylenebutenolidase
LPGIIVVHENRGLNPHIEDVARRLALANFMAFAPDGLTTVGGFPGDDYKGGVLFRSINTDKMTEDFVAAALWLKSHPFCTGKIGITGFCFGATSPTRWSSGWEGDLRGRSAVFTAVPPTEDIPKFGRHLAHHGELDTRLAASWGL